MTAPRPRPRPRPRPSGWEAALQAEVAAAVALRLAEGFEAADARSLVLAVIVGQVGGALAAGVLEGEAP